MSTSTMWKSLCISLLPWLTCITGMHTILDSPIGGTLPNGGKIWALLVAGSNGYYNYRHQVRSRPGFDYQVHYREIPLNNKLQSFFPYDVRLMCVMLIKFSIKMESQMKI